MIGVESSAQVLQDALQEMEAQDAKWGDQSHLPDNLTDRRFWEIGAEAAKAVNARLMAGGRITWQAILEEEVYEAFAEEDTAKLRAELIQVAAVALQWAKAIDSRT